MREFKHPNMSNFVCPICHSSKDAPVILLPIPGTEDDGVMEAKQVHTECYRVFCKMNDIDFELKE